MELFCQRKADAGGAAGDEYGVLCGDHGVSLFWGCRLLFSGCLFFQKAVFVHQWFEFGSEGGVGGFEGGEVGLRSGLFQGVTDFIPACTAFVEQVFVADFAFDVGPVEGLPQFQAFIIHGLGFFGEQAVGRILVSDTIVQDVGFKNPTYDTYLFKF